MQYSKEIDEIYNFINETPMNYYKNAEIEIGREFTKINTIIPFFNYDLQTEFKNTYANLDRDLRNLDESTYIKFRGDLVVFLFKIQSEYNKL